MTRALQGSERLSASFLILILIMALALCFRLYNLLPVERGLQFLQDYDVAYRHGPQAEVMVDPDDLGLPQTFGLGTEHLAEEDFDWSEWAGQWCLDEALSGEFPR